MNYEEKIISMLEALTQSQTEMKNEISSLRTELKEEISSLRVQTKENTDIIQAIKHATEEINAKVTAIDFNVAKLEGEIVGMKSDVSAVETITAKNWVDITQLKKTKNI